GNTANSFVGGVEIWGGTLAFGANSHLGDNANNLILKGGILNNTATVTTSRAITLGPTPQPIIFSSSAQTLINGVNTNSGTVLTVNGAIDGAGGFNKSGSGTLILGAAANSYAGDTQLTAGTLTFTDNAQLGAAGSRIRFSGA